MEYEVLATGSKGNCVIINGEIAIDMGVTWKMVAPYAKKLKLVLLTHVHGDHFKPSTVKRLHQVRPTLRWGCCEWMVGPLLESGVDKRVIDVIEPTLPGDTSRAAIYRGLAIVDPKPLIHDVPNCGWSITMNGEHIFYATDTGTLDGIEAKGYDYYFVEANHLTAEIESRAAEKLAKGEFAYEMRAAATHLSYEQAMDWLYKNMGPTSQYVLLHQHSEIEKRTDNA